MLRPAVCVALLCISAPCASFNPALECRPEKRPPFPSRFEHHLARAGADAAAETKAESGAESERKVGPRSQLGLRGGAEGRAGGLREPHFAPNLAAVLAGTGLAYYANNHAAGWRLVRGGLGGGLVRGVGWGPIMGSGSLGLVASLALPHLAVPFFCGTLAGTASTNVIRQKQAVRQNVVRQKASLQKSYAKKSPAKSFPLSRFDSMRDPHLAPAHHRHAPSRPFSPIFTCGEGGRDGTSHAFSPFFSHAILLMHLFRQF